MSENERISASELKMWIAGMCDGQKENWRPSSEQWKRIRQRIEQLDDKVQMSTNNYPMYNQPNPVPFNPSPMGGSALDGIPIGSGHIDNPLLASSQVGQMANRPPINPGDPSMFI